MNNQETVRSTKYYNTAFSLAFLNHNNGPLAYINDLCGYMQVHKTGVRTDTYTVLFIYLFHLSTQYFQRVTHLAKIAILPCGPLLT